jgi:sec-independent protein translocase protein TatB
MFNLGFSELLILGIIALVFIGPKELPEIARVIGRMLNELKRATGDLSASLLNPKEQLERHLRETMDSLENLEQPVLPADAQGQQAGVQTPSDPHAQPNPHGQLEQHDHDHDQGHDHAYGPDHGDEAPAVQSQEGDAGGKKA